VTWSKDKNSCVQPIIHHAYDLVHSVTDFLDKVKFTIDDLDPFTRVLDSDSSHKVDHFVRELEFACTSISLAVSITKCVSTTGELRRISPSALLKASARIREMACCSGDLFAISGTLFKRDAYEWSIAANDCTLKISQFNSVDPLDSPFLIRLSSEDLGLNFPVEAALSFQSTTVKSLCLPISSHVDSPAIYWSYTDSPASPKRRLLHRNPSGDIDQDLSRLSIDSSDDESVLVHGAATLPSRLRPRISSTHISGPGISAEFAFTYNSMSSSITPLEMVYTARLCVMEAIRHPEGMKAVEASDEVLNALLLDARLMTLSTPETSTPLTPIYQGDIDLVINDGSQF